MDTAAARAEFEEFVVGRWNALARTAYLLTGHREDAEDLLQSALSKAAVRWEKLEDAEAYVRRSLYNLAVSRWRWRRRRPPEVLTGEVPPGAIHREEDRETRLALDAALSRLTSKQRAVLVLRFYEDLSEAQTAEVLGCAVGTVKVQTGSLANRAYPI